MAKVLVVDDEQTLLFLLQQIVEEQGHEVLTAENGQQALYQLENQSPQLVISDVMMPVMDGYALLEELRSREDFKDIKLVLISAAPINRQTPHQADAYLSKPYDLRTIEELIERLI